MADSNITKRALAEALKQLMKEESFTKISVADICERCSMNRKSFYYHFKDKYALMNWIYDMEFIAVVSRNDVMEELNHQSVWLFMEELCDYLYENRDFYRKALKIKGQNSFSDHFRETLYPIIEEAVRNMFMEQSQTDFFLNFVSDAFVGTIERWLTDKNCMTSKEFIDQLKSCVRTMAVKVYEAMNMEE